MYSEEDWKLNLTWNLGDIVSGSVAPIILVDRKSLSIPPFLHISPNIIRSYAANVQVPSDKGVEQMKSVSI